MTPGFGFALACALVLIAAVFEMIRRRYVRGRFAVIWLFVGIGTLTVAIMPDVLGWAANVAGIHVPLNLLFFVGFVAQLLILIQLTAAHCRLEEKVRRLAENVALLTVQEQDLSVQKDSTAEHSSL